MRTFSTAAGLAGFAGPLDDCVAPAEEEDEPAAAAPRPLVSDGKSCRAAAVSNSCRMSFIVSRPLNGVVERNETCAAQQ